MTRRWAWAVCLVLSACASSGTGAGGGAGGGDAGTCGNGTLETSEPCEGLELRSKTCQTEGFALGGTLGCSAACALDTSKCTPCGPSTALVSNALDGDTITLDGGLRVRLLLVDAPENTAGTNDCYGAEATAYTTSNLVGKAVSLAYDGTTCTDNFGRTLGYVTVQGRDFNAELISKGYACVPSVTTAGMARRQEFVGLESAAKASDAGVWGACHPVPCAH